MWQWVHHGVCDRWVGVAGKPRSPWCAAGDSVRAKGRQGVAGQRKVGWRRGCRRDQPAEQPHQQEKLSPTSTWRRSLSLDRFHRHGPPEGGYLLGARGLPGELPQAVGEDGDKRVWRKGRDSQEEEKETRRKAQGRPWQGQGWKEAQRGQRGEGQEKACKRQRARWRRSSGDRRSEEETSRAEEARSWRQRKKGREGGWRRGIPGAAGGRIRGQFCWRFVTCSGNPSSGHRDPVGEASSTAGVDQWTRSSRRQWDEDHGRKERRSKEGPWRGGSSTAGLSRAEEQRTGGGKTQVKEREEKRKKEEKGKGFGERPPEERKEEEKEKEEEEEKKRWRRILEPVVRERWERFKLRGDSQLDELKSAGSFAEEVKAGSGGSLEAAVETREAADGPGCQRGHLGGNRNLGRSQDDELLQPASETLLLVSQPGYEGVVPAGNSHRRVEAGSLGHAGRLPCEPVHSDPNGDVRWKLEERSVLGDAPAREQQPSSHAVAPPGPQACKGSGSQLESRRGRTKRKLEEPGHPRTLAERRERKRQRRQRKGQWKERKRKRTKFLGLRISGRRLEFLGKPEFRPRLVEQKEGRQGCRQEEGRREERVEEKRSYKRGEEASPFSEGWMELSWVAEQSCNLRRIGILMAWLIIQGELLVEANRGLHSPVLVAVLGWVAGDGAVQRPLSQEVFPFPLGELGPLVIALQACSRGDLVSEDFVQTWAEMAWLYVSIRFLNGLHGIRAIPMGGWKKSQLRGVVSLKSSIKRALAGHRDDVARSAEVIEKELSSRFVGYNGEEVAKMEVLSLEQVEPALPPSSHGGSIRAVDWVDGRTKSFLLNPDACLLKEEEVEKGVDFKQRCISLKKIGENWLYSFASGAYAVGRENERCSEWKGKKS